MRYVAAVNPTEGDCIERPGILIVAESHDFVALATWALRWYRPGPNGPARSASYFEVPATWKVTDWTADKCPIGEGARRIFGDDTIWRLWHKAPEASEAPQAKVIESVIEWSRWVGKWEEKP